MITKELEEYAANHSTPESELLNQLWRETYLKVLSPGMLSGHLQGRFLSMLSHLTQPKQILEIGTFTGYSALCLAEGLAKDGILHTIEVNPELIEIITRYFKASTYNEKIRLHIGKALEIIPNLEGIFDLVFIDADKENYINYYDLIFDKVKPGGLILVDNTLWHGNVLKDSDKGKETTAIRAFNAHLKKDDRVEKVLMPFRDGLTLIYKSR
jgi:predicted O-methyltransferase YrrM